jgi:hypothetical protein
MKDVGVLKFGPRERPNSIKWWAERGRIHYQDDDNGKYGSLSRRDFLERLQGLNNLNKQGRTVGGIYDISERERIMRFVEAGQELVKKAWTQGDPDNPEVRKQRKEESLPKQVSMARSSSLILPSSYNRPRSIQEVLGNLPTENHEFKLRGT